MRIFRALSHQQIRWLWGGQVFSAIGDEVYGIALVWYATNLLGTSAGYLSAVQAGSIFLFSLIGGVWTDHRDHRRVMIASDFIRGLAVLALPVIAYFTPLTLWTLIPVAIIVSSLSAFFNPALNALTPQLTQDRPLLQAANGLMETTSRIARVIGPGLVGLLSRFIPLIQYFTIDALSFFASALSIMRVEPDPGLAKVDSTRLSIKETLLAGFRMTWSQPILAYTVYSGALAGAAWMFILPLGMTLLIRKNLPTDVGGLGYLISAYGIGNVTSNILIANFHFKRPERWIFSGRLVAGCGFILLSLSTTLNQMMFASGIAAIGGPLADLGYVNLIQSRCRDRDIARVFRYIMALGNGSLLVVFLASPKLFDLLSVPTVILSSAILILISGLIGFAFSPRDSASLRLK